MKHRYIYHGPVIGLGHILTNLFDAETVASTEKEARRNFEYQFKKKAELLPTAKIVLPGKIVSLEAVME